MPHVKRSVPAHRLVMRTDRGWRRAALVGTVTSAVFLPLLGGPTLTAATAAPSAGENPPVLKTGGNLTVFEQGASQGAYPQGLDPATDASGSANQDYMDVIYGNLFELGAGGVTVPDLATGYKVSDAGKTWDISIRRGVEFSDGTPFDAAAVVYNWKRDFAAKTAILPPWPLAKTGAITAPNAHMVEIRLTEPYSPLINSLHSTNLNWIGSPAAIKKLGKQFKVTPVGAGPFVVVSDALSNKLVVKRNPHYWQKGLPYLDQLTLTAIQSDESALEALRSGQGQADVLMATPQLASAFQKAGFTVTKQPSTNVGQLQLNTKVAPFDNIKAREAMYYATNAPLLAKQLTDGTAAVEEGFTAPTGLFFYPKVKGYRTYNLAKAKALVKQLGGLSFTLLGGQGAAASAELTAMQAMWAQAGIKATLEQTDLPTYITKFTSGSWEASIGADGSWDPAIGPDGQPFRMTSTGPFSGVHDPKLDRLLNQATRAVSNQKRRALYKQAADYESKMAYGPQLYERPVWDVAAKGVSGPGLTTVHPLVIDVPEIWWQYVGYKK